MYLPSYCIASSFIFSIFHISRSDYWQIIHRLISAAQYSDPMWRRYTRCCFCKNCLQQKASSFLSTRIPIDFLFINTLPIGLSILPLSSLLLCKFLQRFEIGFVFCCRGVFNCCFQYTRILCKLHILRIFFYNYSRVTAK